MSRLVGGFFILICGGMFGGITALIISSYLALQKRAVAVRFPACRALRGPRGVDDGALTRRGW